MAGKNKQTTTHKKKKKTLIPQSLHGRQGSTYQKSRLLSVFQSMEKQYLLPELFCLQITGGGKNSTRFSCCLQKTSMSTPTPQSKIALILAVILEPFLYMVIIVFIMLEYAL